jgi:hypothetical protein
MTPDRINLRIAMACGWKRDPRYIGDLIWVLEKGDVRLEITETKNYCGDLNACHEMEKTLSDMDGYGLNLRTTVAWHSKGFYFKVFCATALQRAEAFCRTVHCPLCGKTIWECEGTECKGGVK